MEAHASWRFSGHTLDISSKSSMMQDNEISNNDDYNNSCNDINKSSDDHNDNYNSDWNSQYDYQI